MKSARCIVFAVAFAALALGSFTREAHAADQMPWVKDLSTAQRIAASRGQLVLIHFTADSCPPCRRLEKNVFSERTFAHGVGLNYVPVKVNVGNQPTIAEKFQVKAWPTDVIITPNGQELHRMISPQNLAEYSMSLRQLAWRHKAQQGTKQVAVADFPLKAPKTTMPINVPALGSNDTPGGYVARTTPTPQMAAAAAERRSQNQAEPTAFSRAAEMASQSSTPTAASASAAPYGVPSTTFQDASVRPTQFTQNGAARSPTTMQASVANDTTCAGDGCQSATCGDGQKGVACSTTTVVEHTAPTVREDQVIVNSFVKSAPPQAPTTVPAASPGTSVVTNPFSGQGAVRESNRQPTAASPPGAAAQTAQVTVPPSGPTEPGQAMTQPLAQAPSFQQPPRTTLADGAHASGENASRTASFQQSVSVKMPDITLAMEGYCPVTLIDDNDWIKGDKQWGARHRGRVFLFHSLAAQQRFLADPERYSPILVGYDPVAFKDLGLFVEGKREHGIRFKNQIVLFGSESSLEQFASSPQTYMQTVYQAMQQATTVR